MRGIRVGFVVHFRNRVVFVVVGVGASRAEELGPIDC